MKIEHILNEYFKFDNLIINRFFDKRLAISYENVGLIRKFIFDNCIIWHDEINKKNQEPISPIDINEFKYKNDVFITSLSNEHKFQVFIEEYLNLTTRLFTYLNEKDLKKTENNKSDSSFINSNEIKINELKILEENQQKEYYKEIYSYKKDFDNYEKESKELKDKLDEKSKELKDKLDKELEKLKNDYSTTWNEYIKNTNSEKILNYRNYLVQDDIKYLELKFKNIIPDRARTKIFKDYYIRLRYLSKCFNMDLYKTFLTEKSSFKETKFYNFLPIENTREHLSLNTIDKTPILTQQNYENKTYADLYCPTMLEREQSMSKFEQFNDDFLIIS